MGDGLTGVMVLYSDDESFTYMTPEGAAPGRSDRDNGLSREGVRRARLEAAIGRAPDAVDRQVEGLQVDSF